MDFPNAGSEGRLSLRCESCPWPSHLHHPLTKGVDRLVDGPSSPWQWGLSSVDGYRCSVSSWAWAAPRCRHPFSVRLKITTVCLLLQAALMFIIYYLQTINQNLHSLCKCCMLNMHLNQKNLFCLWKYEMSECPAGWRNGGAFLWCRAAYVWFPPPPAIICSWGEAVVEGWGVFSPIIPSGTITPVTFRNLTFSPGGAERRSVAVGGSGSFFSTRPAFCRSCYFKSS